jgi:hypothetical protein
MAKIPKLKFKINLDEMFGDSYSTNSGTRQAIGQAIIDRIVSRTREDMVDKFGRSLGKYSPSYKDSLDFKVLKKGQTQVNLTASGDMLDLLTIIEETPNSVTIGWKDDEQNTKAFGHISGMEGHPVLEGRVKKRDFFGLPKNEINEIAAEFEDQVIQVDAIESAQTRDQLDRAITDIIAQIGSDDGEG